MRDRQGRFVVSGPAIIEMTEAESGERDLGPLRAETMLAPSGPRPLRGESARRMSVPRGSGGRTGSLR
jgi:hypothetical protein